ncbi:variable surface protein [Plasmodium gonderi]|uniref:Variable surface protein n=1 Tax=Plasmodium gonderi TaxID=77519 RepID=A0A1Y1JX23_PLAGO|nr:variable surface protein [Plasmodium gonderi]GAW84364.1 variable surface protein [Plasmodium gonderi]
MSTIGIFDFKGIYPTCMDEYNSAIGVNNLSKRNLYKSMCRQISKKIAHKEDPTFTFICEDLCLYLSHIKEKDQNNRETYCKYFFYKLNDELINKKYACIEKSNCYNEMKTISKENGNNNLFDICQNYSQNIRENILSIFQNLDNLYKELELIRNGTYTCLTDSESFDKYMLLLQDFINNDSLKNILETVNDQYIQYNIKLRDCLIGIKISHYILKTVASLIVFASITSLIIFILYKYTPYGSYVYPIVKKLISLWNRRKKKQDKLFETFEKEYKKLTDNNYQLLYNLAEC